MGLYLIGDVQGCDAPLERLLNDIDFSPSRDSLVLLGDLVNRGPASLAVLRRLAALGDAAQCLLGNHDLHALAVAAGVRPAHRSDTLGQLLDAPDAPQLLDWLRHRPLALLHAERAQTDLLMVHAGVLPRWSAVQTLAYAQELANALRAANYVEFLKSMYGNLPARWSASLQGMDRLRVIVNALTRLRFCSVEGEMEFASKEGAGKAPEGYLPWFDVPGRQTSKGTVAFGHWSTLGLINRPNLIALDTGCVWGGCLSAMRVDGGRRDLQQATCPQAQIPG